MKDNKIEIKFENKTIKSDKLIATTKNDEQSNILEQFILGEWQLEELIMATNNLDNLLAENIYQRLTPEQQSLLDNIKEKEKELQTEFIANLNPEERKLYQLLNNLPDQSLSNNSNSTNKAEPEAKSNDTAQQTNKVVNINKYRNSN
ncbi:MAG: hypothetical protein ACQERJ_02840 [Bacillota bacterium]